MDAERRVIGVADDGGGVVARSRVDVHGEDRPERLRIVEDEARFRDRRGAVDQDLHGRHGDWVAAAAVSMTCGTRSGYLVSNVCRVRSDDKRICNNVNEVDKVNPLTAEFVHLRHLSNASGRLIGQPQSKG